MSMGNKKNRFTIRRITIFLLLVLLILIARPVGFLLYNFFKDKAPVSTERSGYTNDASNLNETKIGKVVKAPEAPDVAALQISQLIKQAKSEGKKISIAGAQHSMGGHTIYPDGIVLDMKGFHYMELDSSRNILTVGSGALWSEVIPYLEKYGKSVSVMQSNNSFSVGGSISVNCHGWQPNAPPIAATVESFRLINAAGEVINCSRDENKELFSLVLGGYGLFGVILDTRLKVTDNKIYKAAQHVIKSKDYITEFDRLLKERPDIGLAYGRINVNPAHFMEEAIITTFTHLEDAPIQTLQKSGYAAIRRIVFRSSANSGYGKDLRWKAEKLAASQMTGKKFSRNQLLNEGVEVFQNTDTGYTDILHEYFIPRDAVGRFIEEVKKIIPIYKADLLNITVRNVKKDDDSFLCYAKEEVFGFVMLFNQARDPKAETEMQALTQHLINTAQSLRGTYYLPYRLHATKEQLYKIYPEANTFFLLKKKYDPEQVFRNRFYETYSK
jgi:FAD/FMN-containing dehydrogenase